MDGYRSRGGNSRADYEDEYEERNRGSERGNSTNLQRLDSIPDPGKRFILKDCIGSGVYGDVYEAIDENEGE